MDEMDELLTRKMMWTVRQRYRRGTKAPTLSPKERSERFSAMLSDVIEKFGIPRKTEEHGEYKRELGRRLHTLGAPARKRKAEEKKYHKLQEGVGKRQLFEKLDAALAEFVGEETIAEINAEEAAKKIRRRSRSSAS